jgi:group I intron endonuclease
MIIYKTTNLINGKIYIGQDSNNDPDYLGSGIALKRAIRKYGKINFNKETLDFCNNKDELNEREIYWINEFKSTDKKIGYNISKGGSEGDREAGFKIAKQGVYNYWVEKFGVDVADEKLKEQKQKLSNHNKQNQPDLIKKGRYQIWVDKYGKDVADIKQAEWKKRISEYQQKKLKDGWRHTDEAKEKIKNSSLGRTHSDETKEKMRKPKPLGFSDKLSKIKKGISNGPSKNRIRINQYSLDGVFIKEWDSINEAEKELKIYNISSVCKGKQDTAGGFIWKYKN